MSLPENLASCDACHEAWSIGWTSRPSFTYINQQYQGKATFCYSWCFNCHTVCETEYFDTDANKLKRYIKRLKSLRHNLIAAILNPKGLRRLPLKHTLKSEDICNRLVGLSVPHSGSIPAFLSKVEQRLKKAQDNLSFLSLRTSKPRCLTCGNHWFQIIAFDTRTGEKAFHEMPHPGCSGMIEPFYWTLGFPRKMPHANLDIEGRRMTQPCVII